MDETTQTKYVGISSEVTTANIYMVDDKHIVANNINDALKAWRMWYYNGREDVEPASVNLVAPSALVYKNYDPELYKTEIVTTTDTE